MNHVQTWLLYRQHSSTGCPCALDPGHWASHSRVDVWLRHKSIGFPASHKRSRADKAEAAQLKKVLEVEVDGKAVVDAPLPSTTPPVTESMERQME
jgi:hypothetical protein